MVNINQIQAAKTNSLLFFINFVFYIFTHVYFLITSTNNHLRFYPVFFAHIRMAYNIKKNCKVIKIHKTEFLQT